jgi:Zinc finger, C2H2 type
MDAWTCDGCQKSFKSKHHLARHYKTCQNPVQRQTYRCDMCNKMFSTKTNLRKHQSRKNPCVDVKICEKCGQRFWGDDALTEHMLVHECTCVRCEQDHEKTDERTIIPLTQAFAAGTPAIFCVGCFLDIQERFKTLMLCMRRSIGQTPVDIRNLILMWMVQTTIC